MIDVHPFDKLGQFDNDWLSARYHFSFARYYDPARTGFGPLLVWNDDRIRAGGGFAPHGHDNMEIITYVRRGAVSHRDSLGNQGRTEAGDVQVMSAGTGIRHSEFNQEESDTELFQIWIEPAVRDVAPRWATRSFPRESRSGRLEVLASGRAGDGDALPIHQDAALLGGTLSAGQSTEHVLEAGRRAYLVPARGEITVNGVAVPARSGVAIADEERLTITALTEAEILLADLP